MLWNKRQIDLTVIGILDKCYDLYQCWNYTLITTYHNYHAFHAFAMLYSYSHANKAHCCCRCCCFNKANLIFKWRVFEPTHSLFAPSLLCMNHQWMYQLNVERIVEWLLNWTSNKHLVEYKMCNQIWSRANLILLHLGCHVPFIIHFPSSVSHEGLPGVLGNKGTKGKYRREQGNMTSVLGNTGT